MIGFSVLFLLAMVFVLLPLYRGLRSVKLSEQPDNNEGINVDTGFEQTRAEQNRRVHAEQLADFQSLLDDGKIDEVQFEALKNELLHSVLESGDTDSERAHANNRVAANIRLWLVVSFLLLLAIASSYLVTGYFVDTKAQKKIEAFGQQASSAEQDNSGALLALLPTIEDRVAARPDNLGWRYLLAQLQSELKRHAEAARSYKTLLQSDSENAQLWAYFAQASYLSNARRMNPEIEHALDTAVRINPHQRTALGLRGMHAFETEDYAVAAQAWGTLLAGLPENSPQRALITNARNAAVAKLSPGAGEKSSTPPVGASTAEAEANSTDKDDGSRLAVEVTIDERVQAAPSDAVFIYARAANGPKMPLAIVRLTVSELPLRVELHDGLAMMPAMKLSMFDEIEVIARISQTGSATASAGDWQASSGSLQRTTIKEAISLHIAKQI